MAAVSSIQGLVFMLVASSLFAVSNASVDDNSPFIIFGVVAGGSFLFFICIFCYFAQLQQRHFRRYWSAGRFSATTVAYTGTSVPQLGPHNSHQRPPAFQQTCPCHPSPLPEQHPTFTPPPPHNPEATEASEPLPPSYIEVTQGRSGGVYAPHVPGTSPSALPMDGHQNTQRRTGGELITKLAYPQVLNPFII